MSSDRLRRLFRRATGAPSLVLVLATAGACAPAGPVFEPRDPPLLWPAPPEAPRIEYVGQLASSADLKAARSLGAVVFGDDVVEDMQSPYGVCTDGGDRVFVSDNGAQLVHVFDLSKRTYERWIPHDGGDGISQTLGLAWDPEGRRLFVADAGAGCVHVLDADGRVQRRLGVGELQRPCGLAIDGGRLFVADPGAHQVVVFDSGGAVLHRIGGRGVEPGRFNFPTHVAIDAGGRLFVADSLNFRVQVFDDRFEVIGQIGSQGDRPGFFAQPKGLAIDRDGHVHVVDAQFEAVQIFDDLGQLLLAFGREGHADGEFWLPAGIHIDANDRIWIADSYNRRVQVFRYLGQPEESTTP